MQSCSNSFVVPVTSNYSNHLKSAGTSTSPVSLFNFINLVISNAGISGQLLGVIQVSIVLVMDSQFKHSENWETFDIRIPKRINPNFAGMLDNLRNTAFGGLKLVCLVMGGHVSWSTAISCDRR